MHAFWNEEEMTPYDLLGVEVEAPADEIRKSYCACPHLCFRPRLRAAVLGSSFFHGNAAESSGKRPPLTLPSPLPPQSSWPSCSTRTTTTGRATPRIGRSISFE